MPGTKTCPHCGQTMPPANIEGLPRLTPIKQRMLTLLVRAGNHGINFTDLYEGVYHHHHRDPAVLRNHVSQLRRILKPLGWKITMGWFRYSLVQDVLRPKG